MKEKMNTLKKKICAAGMMIAAAGISVPAVVGALPVESVYAAGDVEINSTNFPDENFRKYISENIDTDGDGKLSTGEISECKDIDCGWRDIDSLKGIEYFTALEHLDCDRNNLSILDVSKNTALTWLGCHVNNLSSLDVSNNTALEVLYCGVNNLSSLDVSKNTALEHLDCDGNNLSSLDVSKNTALGGLNCGENNLSNLDVSRNTALEILHCERNNLSSLDVSKNAALEDLYCDGNNLSSLDVSRNTALGGLNCGENNLSNLDVSRNTSLTWLGCSKNNLISLDVSKNTALRYLGCSGNNLSSLDVSKNTALESFSCSENNLISLDVSKNTALYYLVCESQNKEVTAVGGTLALSAIDPNLKASAISNLKGATLSGDKLTNITGDTITYDYATGYGDTKMDVTLKVNKEITPESVSIDKKLLVLDKGKSGKLTATVKPDNAKDKTVNWTSSNTNVATVDASGNVTAVNHGTAIITAKTSNGKTAECEVRVNFADVASTSQYYYNPVYWAAETGITTGANGLFAPHNSCTREHAITFLWRMAGSPQPKSMVSKFKDVQNKNSYSYKAIMWGTEKGIITGSGGVFAPNNTCTREQIVTMLWRLAGKPAPKSTNSKFKDVKNKNSYSYKAILWASEKGITTGSNGMFKPSKTCTRAEIVTFIYRYKNTVK